MACSSCQRRQQMLKEAKQKDGVKGVVKVLPAVVGSFIRGGKRNG